MLIYPLSNHGPCNLVLFKYNHLICFLVMLSRREKNNYNCIMEIMNVAVCDGLRQIFKQEWDKHYGVSKGHWDDTPLTGNELFHLEKTRAAARHYLQLFKFGKRSDWDSSALSDAILYSNALGARLSPHVFKQVDELRDLRNKLTHSFGSKHKMSDVAFENAYKKVETCFNLLSLSTAEVKRIRNLWKGNRVTGLWEDNRHIFLTVVFLTIICLLCSALFMLFTRQTVLFKVLPSKPVHLIASRSSIVDAILKELHALSARNNRALTYLYISGNPGSGKSQLARLVGERYTIASSYRWFGGTTFVMTLNGKSASHMLNSYIEFARRLDCDETAIASILSSKKISAQMKIKSLQIEILKALKIVNNKYTWLLIVDNVIRKQKKLASLLPQLEDKDWQGGQVLITTQDMSSVPPNSFLTVHISVNEGMDPVESCKFLTDLSGNPENQKLVEKVAKELDYQPLALACAASYIKQLRERNASSHINWSDYLDKLDEGKRNITEVKLTEVNESAYSLTLSTAVLLVVKYFADSDHVLKHVFTFLSFVSHEPIPLHLVENYVLDASLLTDVSLSTSDIENIRLRIRECFFILLSDESRVSSISLQNVVHDIIKLTIKNDGDDEKSSVPGLVLQTLILPRIQVNEKILIPHLKSFYIRTETVLLKSLIPQSRDLKQEMYARLFYLSQILEELDESFLSKHCSYLAFQIFSTID